MLQIDNEIMISMVKRLWHFQVQDTLNTLNHLIHFFKLQVFKTSPNRFVSHVLLQLSLSLGLIYDYVVC